MANENPGSKAAIETAETALDSAIAAEAAAAQELKAEEEALA